MGRFILVLVLVALLILVGCAPGNDRWDPYISPGNQAGFWAGVWHGIIIVVTFVVSLFTRDVGLYEVNNTGWPYNLGFLIGLMCSLGGGMRVVRQRKRVCKHDWDKVGRHIEEGIRAGFKELSDDAKKEKEWSEIGEKLEEKIRRILKEWVEEE